MPTRSPRVNVCVTPSQHQLLKELAEIQGCSAASLVREMVDAAEPMMRRTLELARVVRNAQGASREAALEAMKAVLDEIQQLTGESGQGSLFEALMDEIDGSEAAAPARSGATEDVAASPPSSNTGVRSAGPPNRRGAE